MITKGTLCLIPAKGSSTRLPRKNLLPLAGFPLVAHSIRKALASKLFDTICVSTEDNEIAQVSKQYGAEVPFIRPDRLSHDPSTVVDVILHALSEYREQGVEFQKVCVLLPTAPFVTIDHIKGAFEHYKNTSAESLMSVSLTQTPPFNAWIIVDEKLAPCFPDSPYKNTKSTECPKTYLSNGAILIIDVPKFEKTKNYRALKLVPYVMPQEVSLDIDHKIEYDFARFLVESGAQTIQREIFL